MVDFRSIVFPLISVTAAALCTQNVLIPFYLQTFPGFVESVKGVEVVQSVANYTASNFHYDPWTNHTINICFLSAFAGYWSMSIVSTILDILPLRQYKTQGSRSYFTVAEWLEAVLLSNVNLLFFSWFVTLPLVYVWYHVQQYRGIEMIQNHTKMAFDLWKAIIDTGLHVVVVDVWFYATHRLLHHPLLYKYVHKLHHRFKAPTAVACMYANPIEFTIGNHLGVALGPVVSNCHPYTAYFWFFLSLFNTAGCHSGYYIFDAEAHDIHHEKFRFNYGVGGIMDYLFGTYFISQTSKKTKKN